MNSDTFDIKKELPFLILGEGPNDTAFFKALLANRSNLPKYHVVDPVPLGYSPGGKERWPECLGAIKSAPGFPFLKGLIIAGDKNGNDKAALRYAIGVLEGAKFPKPERVQTRKGRDPAVAVLLLPTHKPSGSLETLCVDAAEVSATKRKAATKALSCADAFIACARLREGEPQLIAKARLRAILLARHKPDPNLSLSNIWRDCANVVPLDDKIFNRVADFLVKFQKGL